MGASGSQLGPRHSRTRVNRTNRFNLYSLLCGSSTSRAIYEMENHPVESQGDSTEVLVPAIIEICKGSEEESSTACCTGPRDSISAAETGISSGRNFEDSTVEEDTRSLANFNERKNLSESKELVSPHQVSSHHSYDESSRVSRSSISSSGIGQSSAPVSMNVFANKDVVNGINNSVDNDVSPILSEVVHPSSLSLQGLGDSSSGMISAENHMGGAVIVHNSESDPAGQVSNSLVTSQILRHESSEGRTPSGLGLLVSNRERGETDGSLLHVDVVTISTNILPSSNNDRNHEARRNGRRLFWDAFSRRSSRRHGDSPTVVFTANEIDNPSSRDRWLLDLSGDIFGNGVGDDSGHLGSRINRMNEQRQQSRSEIWERLRGGLDDINRWNYSCPLGLHPDGACSCEGNTFTEEASTRTNISRIVMLAEALFEVLDEIHRQPASLSLSMVSVPAPESIVNSFPLKNYRKVDPSDSGDDVEQCYICLADYEEGDKIRVLPCQHEYHMACVDKWLKEIHGVCPLCRGDVCEGLRDSAAPTALVPSPLR